jgi:hypothetical protein
MDDKNDDDSRRVTITTTGCLAYKLSIHHDALFNPLEEIEHCY